MFALNKILFPVDFSEKCAGAARYAKALASQFGSQVILFHAIEPYRLVGGPEIPALPDLLPAQQANAEAQLERFGADAFRDLAARQVLSEGDPARRIVEYAHAEGVDLIVMPTHGYGPFRRFLLGSVTAKVLHDADCPVWTGVHLEQAPAPETIHFHRIACAVDLGPQSEKVLSWASGMASGLEARLLVMHVTPSPGIAVVGPSEPEPEVELAQRARRDIEDLLKKTDTKAEVAVGSGDILQTVYDLAARQAADVLVIGRGATKGIVGRLRSHAYAIIRTSPCPVISV
ncbi:MAG TPA: universal stress protein [Bryobacterales bacterium]|nr:universal stress protein [Bryobacterales bacterium]